MSEKIFQMGFISTIGYEVAKSVTKILIVKISVSPIKRNRLQKRRPLNKYTNPSQHRIDIFFISLQESALPNA